MIKIAWLEKPSELLMPEMADEFHRRFDTSEETNRFGIPFCVLTVETLEDLLWLVDNQDALSDDWGMLGITPAGPDDSYNGCDYIIEYV